MLVLGGGWWCQKEVIVVTQKGPTGGNEVLKMMKNKWVGQFPLFYNNFRKRFTISLRTEMKYKTLSLQGLSKLY